MYFGMFDPTIVILIPAMIFALYAQGKVKSAYNRYAQINNRRGITGHQAARMILDANGLRHVPVEMTAGTLTDHYDPKNDVMRLSSEVYNGTSIASVSIAAHESGHAIQDGTSYAFLRFRSAIAPVVSLVSVASWPLILIGLAIIWAGNQTTGNMIFDLGILFFAAGYPAPELEIDSNVIHYRRLEMIGTYAADTIDFFTAGNMLNSGAVDVSKIVEPVKYKLDDVQEAFKAAATPGMYRVSVLLNE